MSQGRSRPRTSWIPQLLVVLAATLPYLPTLNDYFVRDDFGVVQLLAQKPFDYFPRWFASSWMEDIWGYLPDEVRPFPALSYQLTALGGPASPVLHHVLNIAIHAINGLLVMAIAQRAAGLSRSAATFAAVVFVLLPVHTESVAWVTGRVDSMPALFYLASFLAYVGFRQAGGPSRYVWSLLLFFVALFTKQNTITMVATLVGYDVLVARRPLLPLGAFVAPYLPFALMTAGYLWLRYELFGQIARESALSARALEDFGVLLDRHLRFVVVGAPQASTLLLVGALAVVAGAWLVASFARATDRDLGAERRTLLYFGPVWCAIGVLPIAVAGYYSPRHVYLAAVGWAIVLGLTLDFMLRAGASAPARRAPLVAGGLVVTLYLVPLWHSVRDWRTMSAVSHQVVQDVREAAMSGGDGRLIVIGAPGRSWEWALPFSVRPPFQPSDLTRHAYFISPRALSCCSGQWFDETRRTIRAWSASGQRDQAVALRWDAETGALARADGQDVPVLIRAFLEMNDPDQLDTNLRRMLDELPTLVR